LTAIEDRQCILAYFVHIRPRRRYRQLHGAGDRSIFAEMRELETWMT
jgi:hypothetical protein